MYQANRQKDMFYPRHNKMSNAELNSSRTQLMLMTLSEV